jgi:hypothetical protein
LQDLNLAILLTTLAVDSRDPPPHTPTKSDTAGEVIFWEASQSANQLVERAPSVNSGLFPTSPSVSKATMSQKILTRFAFMADDGYP